MVSAKIVFSPGKKVFAKGGGTRQTKSITQRVESIIHKDFEDSKVARKMASAHRKYVEKIAQAHYGAALQGCIDLVKDSKVKAVADMRNTTPVKGKFTGKRVEQLRYPRFNEREKITVTHAINGKSTPISGLVKIGEELQKDLEKLIEEHPRQDSIVSRGLGRLTRLNSAWDKTIPTIKRVPITGTKGNALVWRKLRKDYFFRNPKSEVFFKKRLAEPSARLSFEAMSSDWKRKVKLMGDKHGVKMISSSAGAIKFQFRLSYPELDTNFDFIRKSFVTGRPVNLAYAGSGTGARGIVYAEMMRPMLRPYASAVGHRFRNILSVLK